MSDTRYSAILEKGIIMCFRPSAVANNAGNQIQQGVCPSCGQPVAASIGIESGECPHCGKPIPQVKNNNEILDPTKNVRVL